MAFLHIQKIHNPYLISVSFKQCAGIPQQFALAVEHKKGCVCLKQIHLCVEAAFSRTAAATAQCVQVSSVLSAIQTHADIFCEDAIGKRVFVPVLSVYSSGIAPFCRAVFLTSAIVASGREINADTQAISAKKKEDSFYAVLT